MGELDFYFDNFNLNFNKEFKNNCCSNPYFSICSTYNPYKVCNNCGIIQNYIILNNCLNDDSIKILFPIHYKRLNYLKELINAINLFYVDYKNNYIIKIYNDLLDQKIIF